MKVHWGLSDPSSHAGSEEEIATEFRKTIEIIKTRIETLINSEIETKSETDVLTLFQELGHTSKS